MGKTDYLTYCKNHAVTELRGMKGWNEDVYGCDLANRLTEAINIDGSATYSRYEAQQYLKEWWNDAAEVYEYQMSNFGEVLHNPFEQPEAFHVCMVIHGVESILAQCPSVDNFWNDEKVLTKSFINKIIREIKNVEEIRL